MFRLLTGERLRKIDYLGNQVASKMPEPSLFSNKKRRQAQKRLQHLEHLRKKTERATIQARLGTSATAAAGVGGYIGSQKTASVSSSNFFKQLGKLTKQKPKTTTKSNLSPVDALNQKFDSKTIQHLKDNESRSKFWRMSGIPWLKT